MKTLNLHEPNLILLEFFERLALIILIVAVFFAPLFGLYYLIKYVIGFFDKNINERKIDPKYADLFLSSKFIFYSKLNDKNKAKFLKRLINFISNKDFHGSGGLDLTDDMIIMISASAIQLTFGLDEYRLDHFSKIFVYPKAYYSKISKQYHKGETNLAGAIILSWNNFTEGYNNPNDKVNLGLHEMAHALRFDKFKSQDYDRFFNAYFDKWQTVAKEEFKKTKDQSSTFFREYGGTNINEFFAVCVESFFESPSDFKNIHPELYRHMSILLNQDPLTDSFSSGQKNNLRLNVFSTQVTGNPFYISGNNAKNVISLIFAAIIWCVIVIPKLKVGVTINIVLLGSILLIIGYLITVRAFSKVFFYNNGVIIKSLIPDIINLKKELSYDEIIIVEFEKARSDETNDTIKITFLNNGKIRTRSFTDTFHNQRVLEFADILITKKVAVKHNFSQRRSEI